MSLRNAKVLVTGATGFIGSHLTRRLVSEGADVVILAEPGVDLYALEDAKDKVEQITADLRNYNSVEQLVKTVSPDRIFHLAAFTNPGRDTANSRLANEVNVGGTVNLLQASLAAAPGLKVFINTGTCEEYGNNPAPFREDMLPWPVSPYSASKSAAWVFCELFRRSYSLPIVSLRPFLTYGPYQKTNRFLTSLIVSCILGKDFKMSEGKQKREVNYIDDIIEGFILASQTKKAIGQTINIGNGIPHTVRELAEKVRAVSGSRINLGLAAYPYRENEIWNLFCDNTKARKILGWKPETSLEDGLARTVSWYKGLHKSDPSLFKKLIV
ncbi:MAG: SDR family NAD(P)-dependent oxidoreductase [Candidatus Altiarchaeota archaeon]|nr:SDR family NAD(P)-dependent oxidoreductase [Candidatus Altiarchaeota archaeon]